MKWDNRKTGQFLAFKGRRFEGHALDLSALDEIGQVPENCH